MKRKIALLVTLFCSFIGLTNADKQVPLSQSHQITPNVETYYSVDNFIPTPNIDGTMVERLNGAGFADGSLAPTLNSLEKGRQEWVKEKREETLLKREQHIMNKSDVLSYNRVLAIGQPYNFAALQLLLQEYSRYQQNKVLIRIVQQQRRTNQLLQKLITIETQGRTHV